MKERLNLDDALRHSREGRYLYSDSIKRILANFRSQKVYNLIGPNVPDLKGASFWLSKCLLSPLRLRIGPRRSGFNSYGTVLEYPVAAFSALKAMGWIGWQDSLEISRRDGTDKDWRKERIQLPRNDDDITEWENGVLPFLRLPLRDYMDYAATQDPDYRLLFDLFFRQDTEKWEESKAYTPTISAILGCSAEIILYAEDHNIRAEVKECSDLINACINEKRSVKLTFEYEKKAFDHNEIIIAGTRIWLLMHQMLRKLK